MTGFRLVLQDMEQSIKHLSKEKEAQYLRMKESISLMANME